MLVMVNHTQRFKILLFQNFKMFLKNVSKNLCKSIQGIHQTKQVYEQENSPNCTISRDKSKDKLKR